MDELVPEIAPGHRFQWEDAQECHVILYPEGMVKLSRSAGEILKRCTGSNTVAGIIKDLESAFAEDGLKNDIEKFIRQAQENGWIRYK